MTRNYKALAKPLLLAGLARPGCCGGAETPCAGAAGGGNVWRARRAGRCDQAWPRSDPAARGADALIPVIQRRSIREPSEPPASVRRGAGLILTRRMRGPLLPSCTTGLRVVFDPRVRVLEAGLTRCVQSGRGSRVERLDWMARAWEAQEAGPRAVRETGKRFSLALRANNANSNNGG